MAYAPEGPFVPNAFIRIDKAGKTTLVMPQVEMGQGVYTSMPMILAEELDADYAQVALMHAPPNDKLYGNPAFGIQATGNSNSVRAFWMPLRKAGAEARAMLVQAAAQQWQVEPASCTTANGQVIHAASGRKLSYGALAEAASSQTPPKDVAAQGPEGLHADRQAAETPRYAGQDQRQGRVRHRRDAARHEVRDPGAMSRCSAARSAMSTTTRPRQFPACARWSCSTTWSRSSAITCGRRRRASMPSSSPGTRVPNAQRQLEGHLGRICAPRAQRTGVVAKARRRHRQGPGDGRQARGGLRAAVPRPRARWNR